MNELESALQEGRAVVALDRAYTSPDNARIVALDYKLHANSEEDAVTLRATLPLGLEVDPAALDSIDRDGFSPLESQLAALEENGLIEYLT
ncbi:MAG: hypothetical protein FJZ01_12090 [Candidatus Sericytochromatia bacterium]|nr:hypothetical protein [Candidatus Tanganyikabacteria bacterium]